MVLRANDGGQCDPFEDGYDGLAVKGRYFTVQNGVACGAHVSSTARSSRLPIHSTARPTGPT
ncbi:hypothetical protein BVI434_180056 [Burkholderia vietnamiensis]|nr:hypothetical protein BVI434_180056 [Burkholderia vietnamiensis]